MQSLYAFHSSPNQSINLAEKELFHSINKSYDLYHLLLLLLVEVQQHARNKIEQNKQKQIPTESDLNPNLKFIENDLILKVSENEQLNKYIEKNKLSWVNHPEFIKSMFTKLAGTEEFSRYMGSKNFSFDAHRAIVEFFYAEVLATSEELYQILEEQSIFWNDDIEFVISMIIKTLKKFKHSSPPEKSLMPLFKDEEDIDFTKKLFRKSILDSEKHREIIKGHLRNWDIDRVAFIDVLIMEMALCEFINFPSIPTKVSLNEYIDLARYYSTSKSRTFINGILDKILKKLKEEGKVTKAGRGLIGEN
jgi:N utilization substance protein B